MRPFQGAALALVLLVTSTFAFTLSSATAAEPGGDKKASEEAAARAEKAATYCPRAALVFGTIVIRASRCYTLYLMRDTRGLFLVFANPGARIPPGQFVRMNTPAGAKVKGRIFYLVPVQNRGYLPNGTVLLTTVRVQDLGPRLILSLGSGGSLVSVTFAVR